MYFRTHQKGFTLIELLVVIAIIGTLASVVLASLNTAREKARDTKRVADIEQIQKALQLYWLDNDGTYPRFDASYPPLGSCSTCLGTLTTELVSGGHISSIPEDPTRGIGGSGYRYHSTNSGGYAILVNFEGDTSSWCRYIGGNGGGVWGGYNLASSAACQF